MKNMVRAAWVLVIAGLISFGLSFQAGFRPQSPGDVLDKIWIDHVRIDPEPFRLTLFASQEDEEGRPFGGVVRAESSYKLAVEMFTHQEDDKEIRYLFLHDNVKAVTKYKFETTPPDKDDLDMKLTLERDPRNNGRQSVYWSSSTWQGKHIPTWLRHALPADMAL